MKSPNSWTTLRRRPKKHRPIRVHRVPDRSVTVERSNRFNFQAQWAKGTEDWEAEEKWVTEQKGTVLGGYIVITSPMRNEVFKYFIVARSQTRRHSVPADANDLICHIENWDDEILLESRQQQVILSLVEV